MRWGLAYPFYRWRNLKLREEWMVMWLTRSRVGRTGRTGWVRGGVGLLPWSRVKGMAAPRTGSSLIPSLHKTTSEVTQGSNSAKQMRSVLTSNVMWFPASQSLRKYLHVLICFIVRSIERVVEFVPITNSTFRKIMSLRLGKIMVWRSCKKH